MSGGTFGVVLFVLSLAAILLLAVFFVICRRYEDGLVGNLALGGMAIACGILLWDALAGTLQPPAPLYSLLIVSLAIFMVRHAYRFAMFHWHGAFGWTKPNDAMADATVTMKAIRR